MQLDVPSIVPSSLPPWRRCCRGRTRCHVPHPCHAARSAKLAHANLGQLNGGWPMHAQSALARPRAAPDRRCCSRLSSARGCLRRRNALQCRPSSHNSGAACFSFFSVTITALHLNNVSGDAQGCEGRFSFPLVNVDADRYIKWHLLSNSLGA